MSGGTHPKTKSRDSYTPSQLADAIKAHKEGLSIRKAALRYKIPKSTLNDKIRGKSNPTQVKKGPTPLLSQEVENHIAEWAISMSHRGFPRRSSELKSVVKEYLDKSGLRIKQFKDNRPGKTWFYGFLRPHPRIATKKAEALEMTRAMACSEDRIKRWYNGFSDFCKENGIVSASQIYNADESGFALQPGSNNKVCTDRFILRPMKVAGNSRASITTMHCICADGTHIPPSILFKGQQLNPEYALGFPDSYFIGATSNGWMDSKQFYGWLTNHFAQRIPREVGIPVLLLIDGHTSHINLHTSKFCADNKILLYKLPPHSSHATQPLDRSFFGFLKVQWEQSVSSFIVKNCMAVTKRNFGSVFTEAFSKSTRADIIRSSFIKSGIWPINFERIDKSIFVPAETFVRNLEPTISDLSPEIEVLQSNKPTLALTQQSVEESIDSSNIIAESEAIIAAKAVSDSEIEVSRSKESFMTSLKNPLNESTQVTSPKTLPTIINEPCTSSSLGITEEQLLPEASIADPVEPMTSSQGTIAMSSSSKTAAIIHPTKDVLNYMEKVIGEKKLRLFKHRKENLYDINDDAMYLAWLQLENDWERIQKDAEDTKVDFVKSLPIEEQRKIILDSICTLPKPPLTKGTKKRKKQLIPNHLSCSKSIELLELADKETREKLDKQEKLKKLKK